MKRFTLILAVAAALLVPAALLTGSAAADNPHGPKSDPNAGCNGQGQGANCSDPGLPQSDGCLHGQAPVQNPHCQVTPSAPTGGGSLGPAAPASNPGGQAGPSNKPASGVAGAEAGKQASGNAGTAAAVNSAKTIDELPFTGLETLWLALVGGGMLGLGLFLRFRLSKPAENLATATDADSPVFDGEEARDWHVPELGVAPSTRGRGVHLPFSEFESLGRLLIEKGNAQMRAGPGGALLVVLDTG